MVIKEAFNQANLRFKQKIGNFKPKDFQLVAASLCIAIAVCSVWLGKSIPISSNQNSASLSSGNQDNPSNDKNSNDGSESITAFLTPLIVPLIAEFGLVSLFLFFVNNYVNGHIEKIEKEYEANIKSEQLSLLREEVQDAYRLKQELEFLYALYVTGGNKFPQSFSHTAFCKSVQKLHLESRLLEEVKKFNQELEDRKEAESGLIEAFTEDSNRNAPFYELVAKACHQALGIEEENKQWASPLYYDITAYLKAWLTCSIRYGIPIPIEPFFVQSLGNEGEHLYEGRRTYVKALKYVRDVIAYEPPLDAVEKYLPTPQSRRVVKTYLEELIALFENDSLDQSKYKKNITSSLMQETDN